jgi:hypothetical protein
MILDVLMKVKMLATTPPSVAALASAAPVTDVASPAGAVALA